MRVAIVRVLVAICATLIGSYAYFVDYADIAAEAIGDPLATFLVPVLGGALLGVAVAMPLPAFPTSFRAIAINAIAGAATGSMSAGWLVWALWQPH